MELPICSRLEQYRYSLQIPPRPCNFIPHFQFQSHPWANWRKEHFRALEGAHHTIGHSHCAFCILVFCISEHWKVHITYYSIWFLGKSLKKLAVCPLVLTLSTGYWSQRRFWMRLTSISFFSHSKIFARAQRINLVWCYGTPPPTCWWRRSSCTTPLNRWWQSLEEPLDFSLASPLWHFGTELRHSSESCQSNNHFKI